MNPAPWIAVFLLSAALHAQPAASVPVQPGGRLSDNPHAMLGELGWNGLGGGLGVLYSHYFPAQASVADLAFGMGFTGARIGARYRHLLVPHRRTSPFLGVGLNYATGLGDEAVEVTTGDEEIGDTIEVRIHNSANLLFNVGLDLKANNGFVFVPSIGWGIDLMDDDYEVVSGVANPAHRQALRLMLKGGFLISFALGWSF